MRKKEQRLWDAMKRNQPPDVLLTRVENIAANGMPDVHCASKQCFSWVELKSAERPKRSNTRLLGSAGLRPEQANWHGSCCHLGLPSYILIRDDQNELYFVHCAHWREINDMSVEELRAVRLASDWSEIFIILGSES